MPFRAADIHDLEVAREVRIETRRADGKVRAVVIWIVVDGGEVFVRSVRAERGRWYQDALLDPHVTIDDEGRRLEALAVLVKDPTAIERVDGALKRKYRGAEGLDEMLVAEARETTLRLDPRTPGEIPLEAPEFLGAEGPNLLGPPVDLSLLEGEEPVEEDVLLQPHKSA